MYIDIKNIEKTFEGLSFKEDGHKYSLNGKPLSLSVSGLIKHFYSPFDSKGISKYCAKRDHVSQKEILDSWKNIADTACALGTKVHLFGENYFSNRELKPSDGFEVGMVKFWESIPKHIIPVIPELQMYHLRYFFCGTCDVLLYDTKDDSYILVDYKTNKDLFKNYKEKKMLEPFATFLDNPFNKYMIQLSLYQILFEQTGQKISKRIVAWVKPNGTFHAYETADCTDVLNKYLENYYGS